MVAIPNILPVSDLRNYNEVLKSCQVGEPVFLTKNGRGSGYRWKWLAVTGRTESYGWKVNMMKLRINPLVAVDLRVIKDFIAKDNEDKALETVQEIYRQFEYIQQFPHLYLILLY